MAVEINKYDIRALDIYNTHKRDKGLKEGWPNWHHLKRSERDYWRALAQVSLEEDLWAEPEGDF